MSELVTTDSRGRITLGSNQAHRHYTMTVGRRGEVILEPAIIRSAIDDEIASDPDILRRMSDVEVGRNVRRFKPRSER